MNKILLSSISLIGALFIATTVFASDTIDPTTLDFSDEHIESNDINFIMSLVDSQIEKKNSCKIQTTKGDYYIVGKAADNIYQVIHATSGKNDKVRNYGDEGVRLLFSNLKGQLYLLKSADQTESLLPRKKKRCIVM